MELDLIGYLQSEAGIGVVIGALTAFACVWLAQWLSGKPKLITFSPDSTFFQLAQEPPAPPILIRAGQVVIRNEGRKSATQLEVVSVPGGAPAGYVILPSINHQVSMSAMNEWVVEIPYLGPREVITIQILNGPNISTVRSAEGPAKLVPVMYQRVFPKWLNLIGLGLTIWGILSILAMLVGWAV